MNTVKTSSSRNATLQHVTEANHPPAATPATAPPELAGLKGPLAATTREVASALTVKEVRTRGASDLRAGLLQSQLQARGAPGSNTQAAAAPPAPAETPALPEARKKELDALARSNPQQYLSELATEMAGKTPEQQAAILTDQKANLQAVSKQAARGLTRTPPEYGLLQGLSEVASATDPSLHDTLGTCIKDAIPMGLAPRSAQAALAAELSGLPGLQKVMVANSDMKRNVSQALKYGMEDTAADVKESRRVFEKKEAEVQKMELELASLAAAIPPGTPDAERQRLLANARADMGYDKAVAERNEAAETYAGKLEAATTQLAALDALGGPGVDALRAEVKASEGSLGNLLATPAGQGFMKRLGSQSELKNAFMRAGVTQEGLTRAASVAVTAKAMEDLAQGKPVDVDGVLDLMGSLLDEDTANALRNVGRKGATDADVMKLPPSVRGLGLLLRAAATASGAADDGTGPSQAQKTLELFQTGLATVEIGAEALGLVATSLGRACSALSRVAGAAGAVVGLAMAVVQALDGDTSAATGSALAALGGALMLSAIPGVQVAGVALMAASLATDFVFDQVDRWNTRERMEDTLEALGYPPDAVDDLMAATANMTPQQVTEMFRMLYAEARAKGVDPKAYAAEQVRAVQEGRKVVSAGRGHVGYNYPDPGLELLRQLKARALAA